MSQGALRTRNHYILIASSEGKVSAMRLISVCVWLDQSPEERQEKPMQSSINLYA